MNIVIHCAAGLGNIGDEALLIGFIQQYQKIGNITVLCINADNARKYAMYDNCLNDTDVRCKKVIRECDVFVLGGGGLFQDETSIYNIYRWGRFLNYAKKHKKRTMIYANSIGPLNYIWSRNYVRKTLKDVDVITLRDQKSCEELKKLGVYHAVVAADGVFGLHMNELEMIDKLRSQYVCVVVRHWFDCIPFIPVSVCKKHNIQFKRNAEKYRSFIKAIIDVIDSLNDDYGYRVILLPFMKERDFKVADDIMAGVRNQEKNKIIEEESFGVWQYLSIIKNSRFVLGMRLHSIIFSIVCSVPFVALSYSQKVDDLLDYLGFQNESVKVDNLNYETVMELIRDIENDRDNFILQEIQIKEKMEEREALNKQFFESLSV